MGHTPRALFYTFPAESDRHHLHTTVKAPVPAPQAMFFAFSVTDFFFRQGFRGPLFCFMRLSSFPPLHLVC